jgi:hypothetical protein
MKSITIQDIVDYCDVNGLPYNTPIIVDGYEALYAMPSGIRHEEYVRSDDGDGYVYGEYQETSDSFHDAKVGAIPFKAIYLSRDK